MATPPSEEKVTGSKSEAKILNLPELDDLLLFKDGEVKPDLKLKDPQRRLIHQGSLALKSKRKQCRVFLLDHVLIVTQPKVVGGRQRLRMINHPIPIHVLQVSSEQIRPTILGCIPSPFGKTRYQLRVSSLGKRFNNGKALPLLCPTAEVSKTWIDTIKAQQDAAKQSPDSNVLRLSEDILKGKGDIKVNCAALYDNDQTIAYGTNDGVYFQPHDGRPRKAIDLTDVRQIEVLEDLSLLIVLAERSVFAFPLEALDQFDRMNRMSRIAGGQTSFLKAGTCMGRTMVCIVKTASLSSTVKALEQIEPLPESNLLVNRKLKTSLPDKADKLKVFKEFYLATELYSIQFLKTKICAAGATGFEIIDLETLNTQILLDPSDNALNFVKQQKNPRPLCVYSIQNEFLVCYREFAFYVNKSGWKSDKDVVIHWEGVPTTCALHYPYIVAFSPSLVEIRHVDDGSLVEVIHKNNVQCLHAKSSPLQTSVEDPGSQASQRPKNNTLVAFANQVMFLTSPSP
ncbi:CNH domain-containing protein [Rhizoctonia solani]|nr:CNH domain-containing protein [Rhizoctonia solani]